MQDAKTIGRIVGALFLTKLIAGPVQNFTLMDPVVAGPGFLVNAAAHPLNLPLAVMIAFGLALVTIAIAVIAWPVFRRAQPALALAFVALTVVGVSMSLVECMTMMSMQSLSLAHAAATAAGADATLYEGLRLVVGKARNWAHYTNLMTGGVALFTMFLLMYRATLIPRAICAFGMFTVLLQVYSLGQPFFGGVVNFNLLAPLGLAYLALIVWLLWRGFAEPKPAA